jgi:curli production assembly/transport component CsgG
MPSLFIIIGVYYNQPTGIEKAVIGESTPATTLLKAQNHCGSLYKFRDQTGQYKASENGSNFSTTRRYLHIN